MIIDLAYKLLQQFTNKDEVSGYISPQEFNDACDFVQLEWIQENYNPRTKQGYEATNQLEDVFSQFKKSTPFIVSNGKFTKPSDYLHFSSASVLSNYGNTTKSFIAELVRDSEWTERLSSEINTPSGMFPIITNRQDEFWVAPNKTPLVNLTYIRRPLKPWWNYTVVDGEPEYAETGGVTTNPNNASNDSTDFELDDSELPYIVLKLCKYFAIEVKETEVFQMIENEAKTED